VKKDVRVYIDDVLECIDKIEEYTDGLGEEEFYEDTQIQDAVIRCLGILAHLARKMEYWTAKFGPELQHHVM